MRVDAFTAVAALAVLVFCSAQLAAQETPERKAKPGEEIGKAVQAGLAWLANHQGEEGSWSFSDFKKKCKGTPACTGTGSGPAAEATSLASLAFLGAGHTPIHGSHKTAMKNAVKFLKSRQKANGGVGDTEDELADVRSTAAATMALSELCGLSPGARLLEPLAQGAVDCLASLQKPDSGFGQRKGDPCDAASTAWAAIAFKSAKLSGLAVPETAPAGILKWLDSATDRKTCRVSMTAQSGSGKPEYSDKALACAMIIRLFWGAKRDDALIVGSAAWLKQALPKAPAAGESPDYEYWYFGTLAAFMAGGDCWQAWSEAVLEALLKTQCRKGCEEGSWIQSEIAGGKGRLWCTALNVLSLEICYRVAGAKKD